MRLKFAWMGRLACVFILICVSTPSCAIAQMEPVIESLQFWGNENIGTGILKMQMATKASPWYDFLPTVKPRIFNAGLFYNDILRLRTFYQSQGYFYATVDTTFRIDPVGQLSANIRILEGPRSVVAGLRISCEDSLDDSVTQDLYRLVGQPYLEEKVSGEVTGVLQSLRRLGYAFSKASVSSSSDSVNVHLDIAFALGPVCEISEIRISGNAGVSPQTIRRGMTFSEGSVFYGKALEDSRRQLYRKRLFACGCQKGRSEA
jgi:outer membrane protein assembly factor BamA